jgi:hypothetical protein
MTPEPPRERGTPENPRSWPVRLYRNRSARRVSISVFFWFVFTVVVGLAALIGRVISHPPVSGGNYIEMLRGGDLFVVSTVIAADAIGRTFRMLAVQAANADGRVPHPICSLIACSVCFVCVFFAAQYYVSWIKFTDNPGTEIDTYTVASIPWFYTSVCAAAVSLIAIES